MYNFDEYTQAKREFNLYISEFLLLLFITIIVTSIAFKAADSFTLLVISPFCIVPAYGALQNFSNIIDIHKYLKSLKGTDEYERIKDAKRTEKEKHPVIHLVSNIVFIVITLLFVLISIRAVYNSWTSGAPFAVAMFSACPGIFFYAIFFNLFKR